MKEHLHKIHKGGPLLALLIIYILCWRFYSNSQGSFDSFELEFGLAGIKDEGVKIFRGYLVTQAGREAGLIAIVSTLLTAAHYCAQCGKSQTPQG
jgi:hypothetical protein